MTIYCIAAAAWATVGISAIWVDWLLFERRWPPEPIGTTAAGALLGPLMPLLMLLTRHG